MTTPREEAWDAVWKALEELREELRGLREDMGRTIAESVRSRS